MDLTFSPPDHADAFAVSATFTLGVVKLLPVDMINEHEGARLPGLSRLCGGGKARDILPGIESLLHLLTVFGGGEEVTSRAEVLRDGTIRREERKNVLAACLSRRRCTKMSRIFPS